ncbi:hypothetical protein THII_3403 [Thioploca ingrica]|uniref:Pentapeptide MXKDX repeat protein n=1 Tax=Thioploca ingrica TaxID=40754 RepID=A0A090AQ26_9GAMM|nr:hypothetical protein THII_3403 [Thioploca ingrica]
MKKLLFAISVTMVSLLGLHAYAADNAATTHGLNSNHMRNMDSRNETMPATDSSTKPAIEEKKATPHKKATSHKKATHHKRTSKTKKHTTEKK